MADLDVGDLARRNPRTARSRGFAIRYEDVGEGAAVVLVLGFLQSAADWRETGYVDRIAGRRRVVTVDPLGHGQSDKPHDWEAYRVPDVAGDIVAVMDAAGIERAAMWGYSRGGRLAAIAAVEFPDRVAALIVGGAALSRPLEPVDPIPPWIEALLRGDWAALWRVAPLANEYQQYFERVNDPRVMGAVALGARKSQYAIDLSRVSAPALIYCGGDDAVGPDFASAMRIDAQTLGVEPHILDGRDHAGAFVDIDSVIPLVLAHLEAAGV